MDSIMLIFPTADRTTRHTGHLKLCPPQNCGTSTKQMTSRQTGTNNIRKCPKNMTTFEFHYSTIKPGVPCKRVHFLNYSLQRHLPANRQTNVCCHKLCANKYLIGPYVSSYSPTKCQQDSSDLGNDFILVATRLSFGVKDKVCRRYAMGMEKYFPRKRRSMQVFNIILRKH